MNPRSFEAGATKEAFSSTRWGVVLAAGEPHDVSGEAHRALSELCSVLLAARCFKASINAALSAAFLARAKEFLQRGPKFSEGIGNGQVSQSTKTQPTKRKIKCT